MSMLNYCQTAIHYKICLGVPLEWHHRNAMEFDSAAVNKYHHNVGNWRSVYFTSAAVNRLCHRELMMEWTEQNKDEPASQIGNRKAFRCCRHFCWVGGWLLVTIIHPFIHFTYQRQ